MGWAMYWAWCALLLALFTNALALVHAGDVGCAEVP